MVSTAPRPVPTRRGNAAHRVGGWARGPLWLQAVVVYALIRVVSWALLHHAATKQVWFPGVTGSGPHHIDLALSWDAQWYRRIAIEGYPSHLPVGPDGTVQQNPWAFYPVFPYAVRAVMTLTGGGFATVGPLLALLAGVAAAGVMAQLLRETVQVRGTGPILGAVAVWAAFPSAPALQMAYTESFAMLLLVTYLLLLVRRQWWLAGASALLLGLTRPVAAPLSVVILLAAWLRWRESGRSLLRSREGTALGFAVVATGLSGVLWPAIAWAGTGRRDAYTATMGSWRSGKSVDPSVWRQTISWAWHYHQAIFVVPAVGLVVPLVLSLLLLVPGVAPGIDVRLRVWCAAYSVYLVIAVDGNGQTSIVRYLLPLFPLAVVLVGGARRPRGSSSRTTGGGLGVWWQQRWGWRTTFWVAAGVVGQVYWIWWLVLFHPPADYPP